MSAAYPPLPAANPAAGATQTWRTWLLYATLALMPLSFNVGYYLLASKKALYLSPLDPLLVPLLLLLVWDLFRGRVPHWMIPVPNAVWAAWALLSLAWVTGGSLEAWGKSALLQTTAIGLCAVWVFTHAATGAAAYRRLTLVLGASIGCCLLYALYQYSMPPGVPLPSGETGRFHGGGVTNVRLAGWYEYRGILAAQVAMFVPACVAFAALERDPALRVGAGALAALGLCVCMSGGGVIAACAGTLAVAGALLVSGKKGEAGASEASPASRGGIALDEVWKGWGAARLAGLIVASLLFFCLVVLPRLPRDHPTALRDSLSLYAQTQDGEGRTIDLPSARLRRYQAELNFLGHKEHWKKGAGAGQFQPALDPYFKPAYPKPGARTDDEAAFGLRANES